MIDANKAWEPTERKTQANGMDPINDRVSPYDQWIETVGIPIHRGFYIPDLRTMELGPWAERECNAAFIQLAGQEGVSELRASEIAPGKTLPALRFALDEVVYVAEGRGLTTLLDASGKPSKVFEWGRHSLFLLPRNQAYQLANTQGAQRVRLLHCNYLPYVAPITGDVAFFFNNPYVGRDAADDTEDFYSEAKLIDPPTDGRRARGAFWRGNFFPSMLDWDKLTPSKRRGASAKSVAIHFAHSPMSCHMTYFPPLRHKTAHWHGAGYVIVVLTGEGFSLMWPEGQEPEGPEKNEKQTIEWHEGSVFVPPTRWWHQHFNVGAAPARYLALHPPASVIAVGEMVEDSPLAVGYRQVNYPQIAYTDQEPWIRERFEADLAKRGLESRMPADAYSDPNYVWPIEV
ncbi:MAG: hypothetical protein HW416_1885 [Chloroflexi bacterium]|nr:hypothetical protein [Chloroflexota bacterium]